MSELENCLHCEGPAELIAEDDFYLVVCSLCGIATPAAGEKEYCIALWNARPSPWIPVSKDTLPDMEDIVLWKTSKIQAPVICVSMNQYAGNPESFLKWAKSAGWREWTRIPE